MAGQWTNLFQFQFILSPSDNVKLPEKLFLTHIPIRAHTECVITCPLRLRTGLDKLVAHLDYLCTDHPMLYFNIQRTEKYSIAMCQGMTGRGHTLHKYEYQTYVVQATV